MKQLRMRSFVSATITDITLFTKPRWSMNWPELLGGGGVLGIKMRLGSDQVRHGYLRDFVPLSPSFCAFPSAGQKDKEEKIHLPASRYRQGSFFLIPLCV